MKPPSQQFDVSKQARILVPVVLALLSLGLIVILVAIVLAVLGFFPAA